MNIAIDRANIVTYYLQYYNTAYILARAVIYGITLNNANLVTSAKILFNCVKMSLKTVIYKCCFIIFGFLFMEKERLCLNGALEQLVLHGQIVRSQNFSIDEIFSYHNVSIFIVNTY